MGTASRNTSIEKLQRPAIVSTLAWEDTEVEASKCFIDLATRLGMPSSLQLLVEFIKHGV